MSFKKSYFPSKKGKDMLKIVTKLGNDDKAQLDNNNNESKLIRSESENSILGFEHVQVMWVKKLEDIYVFHEKIGSGQYGKVKNLQV
jgi:hypothetical protein